MRPFTATQVFGPWTVKYEQEVTEPTGMAPDVHWRFIDDAGHGHFCSADGKYPTLRLVTEPVWCDEHDEAEDRTHWVCPHCGEIITPREIDQSILGRPILGPISMTIIHADGGMIREYHLGDEDARAVLANPIEEIPRRTANATHVSTTYGGTP